MYKKYIKRFLDIVLSSIAIIVLFPIIIVIGILVGVDLGFPIIFKQKRIGKGEKEFELYKFRTMNNKTDESGIALSDKNRVTKLGNFLRNYSLDELPELINILKGDMSIVGPRPLLVRYKNFYTNNEKIRHTVRPGLTGVAQVHGRNLDLWDVRLKLDVEYVQNITFKNDIKIIFQTLYMVFTKKGVVIRDESLMKDLDEERKDKIEIHELTVEQIKLNKNKIVLFIKKLEEIAGIENESNKVWNNIIKYKKDKSAKIYGAFDFEKNLIGFIWFYKLNNKIHINYFYIDERYRRCGIGKKLIEEAYKYGKEVGINTIDLNVYMRNINAINFYKKQGFKCEERINLCKKI